MGIASDTRVLGRIALAVAAFAASCGLGAHAEKKTVCTITVNSSDEKDTFRRFLPKDEYEFVELVEKGRPDWLASSCQKGVQCDALIVSGHFNAGESFYSDRLGNNDFLRVDELERASCSNSCPGLFARLKEVYLFGCESLNPDATRYSSAYGESGRERMRRLFAHVPVIYGFSGAAPVGPAAGGILARYLRSGAGREVGGGRPSARLLATFSRSGMTYVTGMRDSDPGAAHRRDVCEFYDERREAAQKLDFVHAILRRDAGEVRVFFERIEKLLASVDDIDRQSPSYGKALEAIARDRAARDRYVAYTREAAPADIRSRMLLVGAHLGWFTSAELRAEQMRLVGDLMARSTIGFAEVDLICSINDDGALDSEFRQSRLASPRPANVGHAAALACLGSADARAQVLRAVGSPDDRNVQIAQAYLRHHPLSDAELRTVADGVTRMPESRAQIRAFDTLGRHSISDRNILEELTQAFATARTLGVQRAIAEVFIRSDPRAIARPQLVGVLREHRLKSPDGRDLIDVLISRLQGG
jgi:hypothetical protein